MPWRPVAEHQRTSDVRPPAPARRGSCALHQSRTGWKEPNAALARRPENRADRGDLGLYSRECRPVTAPVSPIDRIGRYRETEHRSGVRGGHRGRGARRGGYLLEGTLVLEVESRSRVTLKVGDFFLIEQAGPTMSRTWERRKRRSCLPPSWRQGNQSLRGLCSSFCQEHRRCGDLDGDCRARLSLMTCLRRCRQPDAGARSAEPSALRRPWVDNPADVAAAGGSTHRMNRRTFLCGLTLGTLAAPLAAGAQQAGKVYRIGFLGPSSASTHAKRLELLKEAMPRTGRVAVLVNPDNSANVPVLKAMEVTAGSLKVELQKFEARGPNEFESAFSAMAKSGVGAVVVNDDALFNANARAIAGLAAKKRLPLAGTGEIAEVGGAIGYGVSFPDEFRRAAVYVDISKCVGRVNCSRVLAG